MKNASNTMFKIGRIFNIIAIPVSIILIVVGIILTVVGTEGTATASNESDEVLAVASLSNGIALAFVFVFILIFSIISLVICKNKKDEIDQGSNEVAPRVVLIVFGAISDNIFYTLAGIFSLVARSQEAQTKEEIL